MLFLFVCSLYIGNEEFTNIVDRIREDSNGGPVVYNMPQIPVGGFLGVLDDYTSQVENRALTIMPFSLMP